MKTINKLKAPSPYMLVKALAEKEIEKLSSLIEKLAKEKFSEAKINYENT